ncbi:hypothetical protein SAMN05216600_10167 [Pseudomonas cuatrocienegasensis]|uniref:Transposase n=1 Tax=Pseudomonas cuatrocienegasensis TaxID=543360 RepID=A0ABY1AZZ7_9PSED|nr:hypothetical protein SAMN05216600_10167 [Pseudomonas cuatrocienegasensis]
MRAASEQCATAWSGLQPFDHYLKCQRDPAQRRCRERNINRFLIERITLFNGRVFTIGANLRKPLIEAVTLLTRAKAHLIVGRFK